MADIEEVATTAKGVNTFMKNIKNSTTESNMKSLADKLSRREKAHKECRELNQVFDKVISIGTLCCSAATTYLINVHDPEEESSYIAERILGFSTTFISALGALFNNTAKAEEHHRVSRSYGVLLSEVESAIENEECTKEGYNDLKKSFVQIHSNSLGLFPHIRRRYNF